MLLFSLIPDVVMLKINIINYKDILKCINNRLDLNYNLIYQLILMHILIILLYFDWCCLFISG